MRVVLLDATASASRGVLDATRSTLRFAGKRLRVGVGDVAVRIVSLEEMTRLNGTWRRKERPTDVLSFPSSAVDPEGRRHIGDIAICLDVARGQAEEAGIPLPQRCSHLALHGLLHLLGHDHETDDGEMEALEARIRHELEGGAA